VALNAPKTWLIAYDIREPLRLRRVHRYLRQQAVPVPYSVFVARSSAARDQEIRAALGRIIDPKLDDIRIYHNARPQAARPLVRTADLVETLTRPPAKSRR
jgi:CRISPR-associated protein Cas2